ncbi:MAG: hypothetical protein KIC46_03090 [Clostridiales bacterium]|nr:hypothetical protein [Clostridiales bacterium]
MAAPAVIFPLAGFIHPSLECDELKGITRSWQRRVWEHRLFADPATRQHIESCGIQLINYRSLQKCGWEPVDYPI